MDFAFAATWFVAGFVTCFILIGIIANHDAY